MGSRKIALYASTYESRQSLSGPSLAVILVCRCHLLSPSGDGRVMATISLRETITKNTTVLAGLTFTARMKPR